jgi:PKD repeat protein
MWNHKYYWYMKKNIIQLASIVVVFLISSCEKNDEGQKGTKAVFSYVTDGFVVNFTNFSNDASEYYWEFGDDLNGTSSRKSPQYIFKAKGQYVVSLTARKGDVTSTFKDTVTIIGPNIKIDGDFTDWEHVEYTHVNEEGTGGTINAVKTFSTSTNLNFLVEGTTAMALDRVTFYLDTDNNVNTGYSAWQYGAGSGCDYKLEGSFSGGWGGLQRHSGNPADAWGGFSADIASFPEVITYSAVKKVGDKHVVEISIKRELLGTLVGSINYAIVENNVSYTAIGSMPALGLPESKFGLFKL